MSEIFRGACVLLCLFFAFGGCANESSNDSGSSAKTEDQGSDRHGVLRDYVRDPLDSAEGANEAADEHNKKLREALDDTE